MLLEKNDNNAIKVKGAWSVPSEREPHWPTSEESNDFSKAEAVTECKGINEFAEPNTLGNIY